MTITEKNNLLDEIKNNEYELITLAETFNTLHKKNKDTSAIERSMRLLNIIMNIKTKQLLK